MRTYKAAPHETWEFFSAFNQINYLYPTSPFKELYEDHLKAKEELAQFMSQFRNLGETEVNYYDDQTEMEQHLRSINCELGKVLVTLAGHERELIKDGKVIGYFHLGDGLQVSVIASL